MPELWLPYIGSHQKKVYQSKVTLVVNYMKYTLNGGPLLVIRRLITPLRQVEKTNLLMYKASYKAYYNSIYNEQGPTLYIFRHIQNKTTLVWMLVPETCPESCRKKKNTPRCLAETLRVGPHGGSTGRKSMDL